MDFLEEIRVGRDAVYLEYLTLRDRVRELEDELVKVKRELRGVEFACLKGELPVTRVSHRFYKRTNVILKPKSEFVGEVMRTLGYAEYVKCEPDIHKLHKDWATVVDDLKDLFDVIVREQVVARRV